MKLKPLFMSLIIASGFVTPLLNSQAIITSAAAEEKEESTYYIHRVDRALVMMQNGASYIDNSDKVKYGDYTLVTDGEDAPYIKMKYIENGSQGNFYVMPKFVVKNLVTTEFKYVRITYKASHGGTLVMRNNGTSAKTTLVENTIDSGGEWVTSAPIVLDSTMLERFQNGGHNTIIYSAGSPDAELCIKEIGFFTTPQEAYTYYGDSPTMGERYTTLDFGTNASGKYNSTPNYGNCTVNSATGYVDIGYAETTNFTDIHYMAKLSFTNRGMLPTEQRFFRVAYSVKLPSASDKADFIMRNDKRSGDTYTFAEDVNTNGEIVLSGTFKMSDETYNRLSGSGDYSNIGHFSFISDYEKQGAVFTVAAVYFFDSPEEANAFVIPEKTYPKIEILGRNISDYRIVIANDASQNAVESADYFTACIKEITGVTLETVTDRTAVSSDIPEIRIGLSSREGTDDFDTSNGDRSYGARVLDDGSVVITAKLATALPEAAEAFLLTYCGMSAKNVPDVIKIDTSCTISGISTLISRYEKWDEFENIDDPTVITDDFSSDSGLFSEDNGADVWKILPGGKLRGYAGDSVSTTLVHVYEPNVTVSASFFYTAAKANAQFGITVRVTDKDAYVRAGYDAQNGEWFIDYREGADFDRVRAASSPVKLKSSTAYLLKAVADNGSVKLFCDGGEVLCAEVHHVTPGKLGFFAEGLTCSADDFVASLDSGEGTVIPNVSFTLIPEDTYFEGGTAIEMADGSVIFQHHKGSSYKSVDSGKTWVKIPTWATSSGYTNIIRLIDGNYLRIAKSGGNLISQTSYDGGATWVDGGVICNTYYGGNTSAGAGNMNDKITQTASGKLLYGQNYEIRNGTVDGRNVFCEFYYSDDLGKTWVKSDTDSWEIEGNESEAYFGECKLLECADGTIRMYNTWNYYGCLVYSESKDGGKTFGPLVKMPEFKSTQSSVQFVRDPYADNDHTYYMVWIYDVEGSSANHGQPRSRLSLAKSTDGKNWVYIGDIWRWESAWQKGGTGVILNHIVNPSINVTEDTIYIGSGISRYMGDTYHNEQRQHVWAISKSTLPEGKALCDFTDVKLGAPYYGAVMYAVENGLFNGTSATTFEPETTMNRAMFVTVLGRLDKADVSKYISPTFSDVRSGQWYTSYVEWAAANGIVNGIGDGKFGIDGTVTVEQACTILYRYNGGLNGSSTGLKFADFSDSESVSSWAQDAMKWALVNGIYTGEDGKLNPSSGASRSLVATIFANYVKVFENIDKLGLFSWPLSSSYTQITSRFKAKSADYTNTSSHNGIDLPAPEGTPIYAAADGVVTVAEEHYSYGNYVLIDHGNGYETLYAHCTELLVEVDEKVAEGQVIATVGNTGYSFGNHLHFCVKKDGVFTDPENYY